MKKLLSISEVQELLLRVMVEFDEYCRNNKIDYYLIGGSLLGAVRHKGFIPWDDDMDVGMLRDQYERFIELYKDTPMNYELKNYRVADNCDFVITRLYIPDTYIDNPIINKTKIDKRLYFDIFPLDYIPDDKTQALKHERSILKKKKLLSYVDLRNYNNGFLVLILKTIISSFLKPFRKKIIHSLEREMSKYHNGNKICSLASQYPYLKQSFDKNVYGKPIEYEFENHLFFGPSDPEKYLAQLYGDDYMQLPPVDKRRKGCNIYEI